jgi:hypothetical protein
MYPFILSSVEELYARLRHGRVNWYATISATTGNKTVDVALYGLLKLVEAFATFFTAFDHANVVG